MIRGVAALVLLGLGAAAGAGQIAMPRTFDGEAAGAPPPGFLLASMRQAQPGTWIVRRSGAAGWLVHEADTGSGFAMALAPDAPLRDVEASVRVRLAGGARAGGLVWRYVDAADYHAAILDLARRQLTLYRVTGGNRVFLDSEDGLELDVEAWHTLKIVHDETRIEVFLGGIRVFEERDRRDARRQTRGRTGVIATGASEVWFDDLRIEASRERRR